MYNKDIKEEFLSQFPEKTAEIYRYAFYKSFETEEVLEKDLYDFTADEIKDVFETGNHSTINGLKLRYNIFDQYIDWAAKYRSSNINPIKTITTEELESYLDKDKKLYFSETEIREIINKLVNAQDAVIIQLLFEGVGGHALSELSNLHYYDVNWNTGVLQLKDEKNGKRELTVSNECLRLIRSAYQETEYKKANGDTNARNPVAEIIPSDYILKNIKGRTKNVHGVDKHTFYRRLSTVGEIFNYPYFTAKNIQKSGMIKMAKDLFLKTGKLDKEELSLVGDRFGMRKVKAKGFEYHNTNLLKQFINRENILELYDIDIEQ